MAHGINHEGTGYTWCIRDVEPAAILSVKSEEMLDIWIKALVSCANTVSRNKGTPFRTKGEKKRMRKRKKEQKSSEKYVKLLMKAVAVGNN